MLKTSPGKKISNAIYPKLFARLLIRVARCYIPKIPIYFGGTWNGKC
jgi:hypothetical protein